MKETLIYGGAFNPPTIAHQIITEHLFDLARDRDADVWLLPSGNRSDKFIGNDREWRMKLAGALLDAAARYDVIHRIEPLELEEDCLTETYDTHKTLSEKYPDRMFTWVFGADSIETMPSWKQGEWLRHNLSMIAIARAGAAPRSEKSITVLPIITPDISSTLVRARLAMDDSVEGLVPKEVEALLVEQKWRYTCA